MAGQVLKLMDLHILLYPASPEGHLGELELYPRKGMSKEELYHYVDSKEEAAHIHRPIKDFEYGILIATLNETAVKMQDVFREE